MRTSSRDPITSAAEGVTRAFIDWTEEKIKGLVDRFQNKDIAFVSDPETIILVKKQRKTSESELFRDYIEDPDLRILFHMGLTLRRLEKHPRRLTDLREKILNTYDTKGLHIAQFIQNGFFGKLLGNILGRATTSQKLRFEMKDLFENIERTVIFIQQKDDVGKKN